MNDDGSMARLDDLVAFGERHGIKIGTIRDLIAYRLQHDHLVSCVAETEFDSVHGGRWTAKTYRNKIDQTEHIVLQQGEIGGDKPVRVRMHAAAPFHETFGETHPNTGLLQAAMEDIGDVGTGVVVVLRNPTPHALSRVFERRVTRSPIELRDYGVGAQILADLGVRRAILLTNSTRLPVSIAGFGVEIVERRGLTPRLPRSARENADAPSKT